MMTNMREIGNAAEPALAYALERLQEGQGPATSGGMSCRDDALDPVAALGAARRYLELWRKPAYQQFDPRRAIEDNARGFRPGAAGLALEPAGMCTGDPQGIVSVVWALCSGADLHGGARLHLELFREEDLPIAALSIEGAGRFPERLRLPAALETSLGELGSRWTLFTRGGRMDATGPARIQLRLAGVRMLPENAVDATPLLDAVTQAHRHLLLAESPETPEAARRGELAFAARAVEAALAQLDATEAPAPAVLSAIIAEARAQFNGRLAQASIRLDSDVPADMPALAVRRARMTAALGQLFAMAEDVLPRGGVLTLKVAYDASELSFAIISRCHGTAPRPADPCRMAQVRRVIERLHDGQLLAEAGPDKLSLRISAPDAIGRRAEAWIPGHGAFSERSRNVIRLLQSGGPAPPAEPLLAAVLDAELSAWLMPALESPAARNLADELPPAAPALDEGARERLDKALGQLRRGKPRKELGKPPYAGDLLRVFGNEPRFLNALGVDTSASGALDELAAGLSAGSVDPLACLRLMASIRRPGARTGPGGAPEL